MTNKLYFIILGIFFFSLILSSNANATEIPVFKDGDFIRAEGDINIWIVNSFGFKRLVLSPQICKQYGHLGRRGCFDAVQMVSPAILDSYSTSWFYTNGETKDGKVYLLSTTGEDTADLHWMNMTSLQFTTQGWKFQSVFQFNTLEQNTYRTGIDIQAFAILEGVGPPPLIVAFVFSDGFIGDTITLRGFGFKPQGNTVKFSAESIEDENIENLNSLDNITLQFTVPIVAPGQYKVSLINSGGSSNVLIFKVYPKGPPPL